MADGNSDRLQLIQPETWAPPKGYANGVVSRGRILHVAGQIGWDASQRLVSDDFLTQFAQALDNVIAVVRAAGGGPGDVVDMTIFVTDLDAYRQAGRGLGAVWKERFGRHFPAMALLGVAGLVERGAKVEITARAVLSETG